MDVAHRFTSRDSGAAAESIPLLPGFELIEFGNAFAGPGPKIDFSKLVHDLNFEIENFGERLGGLEATFERAADNPLNILAREVLGETVRALPANVIEMNGRKAAGELIRRKIGLGVANEVKPSSLRVRHVKLDRNRQA